MHKKINYIIHSKKQKYIQHLFQLNIVNFYVKKSNIKFFVYTLNMGLDETFFFGSLLQLNSAGKLVLYNNKDSSTLILNIYCPSIYLISII